MADEEEEYQKPQNFLSTVKSEVEKVSHRDYITQVADDLTKNDKQMKTQESFKSKKQQNEEYNLKPAQVHLTLKRDIQGREKARRLHESMLNQVEQENKSNSYITLRSSTCKKQLQQWEKRKIKYDYTMIEREILKQILQDEYALEQKEFWQRRDRMNISENCRLQKKVSQLDQMLESQQKKGKQEQNLFKRPSQSFEYNQYQQKEGGGYSVQTIGKNLKQKQLRTHSFQMRENSPTLPKRSKRSIDPFRPILTEERSNEDDSPLMRHTAVDESRNRRSSKLKMQKSDILYFGDKITKCEESLRYKDTSLSFNTPNSSISQKEIREDFIFHDPHSKMIIMQTFNSIGGQHQQDRRQNQNWYEFYQPQQTSPFSKSVKNKDSLRANTDYRSNREVLKNTLEIPRSNYPVNRSYLQIDAQVKRSNQYK